MHKAQVAMTDLFLAILIMMVMVTSFFVAWNIYQSRLIDEIPRTELELYTIQFANQLTRSTGIPADWEDYNDTSVILALGLADRDRIISENKLQKLEDLDYDLIRNISNLGSYNFYFYLQKGNTSIVEIGDYPSGQSAKLRRNVIYKNETSIVEISLWK